MSLLNRPIGKAISKPQNQISATVKAKAEKEFSNWLQEYSKGAISSYHANLLAVDLIEKVISDRIQATSPSAPDALFSDADKTRQLVSKAQEKADQLDTEDKLEKLLDDLCIANSRRSGNSL